MCLYVLYKTCAGVNIDPMGQTFKKNSRDLIWSQIESQKALLAQA